MQPRVSPYRLAGHLVSAFAIFATLTWTAFDLGSPTPLIRSSGSSAVASVARGRLLPFAVLVAITATSGAFVAGEGRVFLPSFCLWGGCLRGCFVLWLAIWLAGLLAFCACSRHCLAIAAVLRRRQGSLPRGDVARIYLTDTVRACLCA